MSFSTLLDTPFFTGSGGLSDQVPYPWPIAIDGHPFAVDLTHYSWDIPDMMRVSFDSSDRPGEGTFETKGVWRRAYQDWSLGTGQIYADPAKSTDKDATRQFTSSRGIDCWTPRQFSLLPDTELLSLGASGVPTLTFALGQYLYIVLGALILRMTDPQDATPTHQITNPAIAGLTDITTDGNTIYIASTSGIWLLDSADMSNQANLMDNDAQTYDADVIEFANGFLLAAHGPELATFDVTGTKTTLETRTQTNWAWSAIVGAPNAIYAGGGPADRSCIYSISIDPTTGGLAPAIYAGELPRGEALTCLNYYGSVIAIGTTKGFHIASIGSGNSLNIGPLIATPQPVLAMCADANFLWFSWSNIDATHTGCGRANLGEFTDTLLPAYAEDVMTTGPGVIRSIARFNGHTYFTVDNVGLYRETHDGSLVPTATIRMGRLEWGTVAAKTYLGAEIVSEPLNGSFTAIIEDELGIQTAIGGRAGQSSTGRGTLMGSGLGTNSNFYDTILNLTRSENDPTLGPVMRAITARALPLPRETQTWTLPIIATDKVVPNGDAAETEQSQSVKDMWDFFIDLRASGRPVIYQTGDDRILVIVRSVSLPDGGASNWSSGRTAVQGTLLVTIASCEN